MKNIILFLFLFIASFLFSQTKVDSVSGKLIATEIETMPEFPGGADKLMKYVSENLVIPNLKEYPPSGKVYSKFIINADGTVSDVQIMKGSGSSEVDNAVKELILKMPKWKPATQNGKPVNCAFNLPIACIKFK